MRNPHEKVGAIQTGWWKKRPVALAAGVIATIVAVCGISGLTPARLWSSLMHWGSREAEPAKALQSSELQPPLVADLPLLASDYADMLKATESSTGQEPRELLLISTSPGRSPREGMAQIGVDLRTPQTYPAGAILVNGARIVEIHQRFVVLERDGTRVKLEVRGKNSAPSQIPASGSGPLFVGGEASAEAAPRIAEDRLSDVLRVSPVYENDMLGGLRVYPGRQSGIFAQLGLRAGDLIIAMDGGPVIDPTAASLDGLVNGVSMTVTVRRESGTQTLTLDAITVSKAMDVGDQVAQLPPGPPAG